MGRVPGNGAGAANPLTSQGATPLETSRAFGLLARVWGVLRRPRTTLSAVAAAPRWAGILVLSTAAAAAASGAFYSTAIGRQALVDRWERTAAALGQEVDDAGYARLLELGEYGGLYGIATAGLGVAAVTIVVALGVFAVVPRRGGRPAFRQVMAVAAHASVVLALRFVIAAPVGYARESAAGATSVGVWMPLFDETSLAARWLGMLDLVVLWWAVVAGLGFAMLYGRPGRRIIAGLLAAYVGAVSIAAAVMAALGSA